MAMGRSLGVVVLALAVSGPVRAQNHTLAEAEQANECFEIKLSLKLDGNMTVTQDGKQSKLKLGALAEHRYRERILGVQKDGPLATKAARFYEDARAAIAVDGTNSQRILRSDRRLIIAQRPHENLVCYSPQGVLTRDEVETISEHFDTLALAGLLPGKETPIGGTWKIGNSAAQALCLFEGLIENDLTGKLTEVKDGEASIAISGAARGIELGAQAKIKVNATVRFNLNRKRIVAIDWNQSDDREQGPASPALVATTSIKMTRTPIEEPKELSELALAAVPQGIEVPSNLSLVAIRDLQNRFTLNAGRDWQVVSQTENRIVLRLLDRGDFVAQATITAWDKAEPGRHMDAEQFKRQMLSSPGWQAGDVLQEGELPNQPKGRYAYRLTAGGEIDGAKVIQCFYLVAGAKGDQAIVVFTLKHTQAPKLGARDLALVEGLEMPK